MAIHDLLIKAEILPESPDRCKISYPISSWILYFKGTCQTHLDGLQKAFPADISSQIAYDTFGSQEFTINRKGGHMPYHLSAKDLPLPKGWCDGVKNAVIHTVALANYVITYARGWAINSPIQRVRLAGQLEQVRNEIVLLQTELRIKDARMMRILPHHRPFYTPTERMAILELKAARNLSAAQTARMFLVGQPTIASWKRLNEAGPDALIRMPRNVNKFPEFVKYIVCRLKMLCPTMGKVKIAQVLARAGLHLGRTTIERYIKEKYTDPEDGVIELVTDEKSQRVVTAKCPAISGMSI